ncbi:hypothetical protein RND81_06G140000 [Saponaria officinalis]|uniref:Uncharacterized protein n=1 Tax=Saponaria officinalis TaxID=3572 RepID=A0AAW1KBA0_SAPOF
MKKKAVLELFKSVLIALLLLSTLTIQKATACSDDETDCRGCLVKRMKYDCPSCVPRLRCMAKCLWSGKARLKCVKKCDCNPGYPRMSDCKKCLSKCRCSCTS